MYDLCFAIHFRLRQSKNIENDWDLTEIWRWPYNQVYADTFYRQKQSAAFLLHLYQNSGHKRSMWYGAALLWLIIAFIRD